MWCHIQHNAIFVSLRVQLFIIVSFQNQKKCNGGLEGLRRLSKSHILKMAAPTFLFLKSEFILCNIFSPFLFCFWCYRLSLIRVGWYRAEALKLIFQGESPQQLSVFLPCCGASERRTSRGWNKRTIHLSSDCPCRQKVTSSGLFGACRALLSVCCSVAQRRQLVFEI